MKLNIVILATERSLQSNSFKIVVKYLNTLALEPDDSFSNLCSKISYSKGVTKKFFILMFRKSIGANFFEPQNKFKLVMVLPGIHDQKRYKYFL